MKVGRKRGGGGVTKKRVHANNNMKASREQDLQIVQKKGGKCSEIKK